jgi:hypothetical protein
MVQIERFGNIEVFS